MKFTHTLKKCTCVSQVVEGDQEGNHWLFPSLHVPLAYEQWEKDAGQTQWPIRNEYFPRKLTSLHNAVKLLDTVLLVNFSFSGLQASTVMVKLWKIRNTKLRKNCKKQF